MTNVVVKDGNGNPVTLSTALTREELDATPVIVSILNLPATQPVSGTVSIGNFPATQPVSGAVSVSNLPATQAVSGTVTARLQDGAGTALSTTLISGKSRLDVNLAAAVAPGSALPAVAELVAGSDGANARALLTDASGRLQVTQSPSSLAAAQVSVGAAATQLAAVRAGRTAITIINHGTTDVFIGGSGVTAATGVLLAGAKGQALVLDGAAAVYAIVASGSQTVSVAETF